MKWVPEKPWQKGLAGGKDWRSGAPRMPEPTNPYKGLLLWTETLFLPPLPNPRPACKRSHRGVTLTEGIDVSTVTLPSGGPAPQQHLNAAPPACLLGRQPPGEPRSTTGHHTRLSGYSHTFGPQATASKPLFISPPLPQRSPFLLQEKEPLSRETPTKHRHICRPMFQSLADGCHLFWALMVGNRA